MWPRWTELGLGAWLIASPLVFGDTVSYERFRLVDQACGALVLLLASLSLWRRTSRAHLGIAVLAIALAAIAYFGSPRPGPPGAQNEIVVSLLLMMVGIVPSEAGWPPRPWRRS